MASIRPFGHEGSCPRPSVRVPVSSGEGLWPSAGLNAAIRPPAVTAGNDLTPRMRPDMRVAAVYATDAARACSERAHLAAGTTAIREGSRLERAFRDIYTGTQHTCISETLATDAAQIWLGITEDQFGL